MSILLGLVFCAAIGIPLAFWGYQLHTRLPFLPGLWAGALIGGATGTWFGLPQGAVMGAILLGVACSILTTKKPKTGAFLVNFAYGYGPIALFFALQAQGSSGSLLTAFLFPVLLGAALGTVAAFIHPRGWIIVETSMMGATLVIAPIGKVASTAFLVIVFLAVACGGIYVQMNITGTPEGIAQGIRRAGAAPVNPVPAAAAPVNPVPNAVVPVNPVPTTAAPAPAAPAAEAEAPKVCANCGKPLKPGAKFCSECGHAVETA